MYVKTKKVRSKPKSHETEKAKLDLLQTIGDRLKKQEPEKDEETIFGE